MNALTPKEVKITQMALSAVIQDLTITSQAPHPFNPEARKDIKEMLECATSALAKIAKASGQLVKLDPYMPGDENEFLTKES